MSFGGHGHRMNRLIKLLLLDILSCGAVSLIEWSSLIQFSKGKVFKPSPYFITGEENNDKNSVQRIASKIRYFSNL